MHKKLSKNSIWWILYTWLRQIFQLHKLPCCVDRYWWNMPFKGAQHGDGVAGSAVAMFVIASNVIRDNAGYGFSQWEEALLCNAFSHWPSPYPEWSLAIMPLLGLDMHVLVFTVYISLEYILLLCCFMLNPVFNQSQYDTFGLIFPRTSFLMLFPSNSTRDNLGEIQHHNW